MRALTVHGRVDEMAMRPNSNSTSESPHYYSPAPHNPGALSQPIVSQAGTTGVDASAFPIGDMSIPEVKTMMMPC